MGRRQLRGRVEQQPPGAVDLFATRNPVLNTSLTPRSSAAAAQLRTDATRTQLQITQINQDMSETPLRATIVRTVANTRACWDFVFAIQAAEVALNSLTLATKLVEDNRARVEVGTLAPLDVVQAEAGTGHAPPGGRPTQAGRGTAELALEAPDRQWHGRPVLDATIEPVDRPDVLDGSR